MNDEHLSGCFTIIGRACVREVGQSSACRLFVTLLNCLRLLVYVFVDGGLETLRLYESADSRFGTARS